MMVDEILDDAHWTNVQDPVRQMFSALTKAMRTQSAGIRDLDRKIGHSITRQDTEHILQDSMSRCCTKDNAIEIMRQIDTKASVDHLSNTDAKLSKVCCVVY